MDDDPKDRPRPRGAAAHRGVLTDPAPLPGLERRGRSRRPWRPARPQVDVVGPGGGRRLRPRWDPEHGVLVLVTLYGGNDGLNTVVPAADAAYRAARSGLAYAPEEVLGPRRGARSEPRPGRPARSVGARRAGRGPGGRLPRPRSKPLPVDGHLADRVAQDGEPHGLARPLARRHHRRPAHRRFAGLHPAATVGRGAAGRRLAAAGGTAAADRRTSSLSAAKSWGRGGGVWCGRRRW